MKTTHRIALLFILSIGWAQTWQWTGRTHGELDWTTIETEHFRIHHHQGIEAIALEGASLAEQVRPTLLKQMDMEDMPIIDIIFTTEDEIMNGFALWTYTTFIWVDQNDAAIWLEDEKWLYQVLAHELQHIVFFHRTKTWVPQPFGFLLSQTPGWVVEGLAEYETERWRPYRADISHKFHVLKNKMDEMDPHHDGYSKLLYWSDRFGDSTIVQTLSHRNKLGIFNFEDGFKKHTGISVEQFNEDWRRHMNTYYYGYRSQKEAIEEIGKVVTLPVEKVAAFSFLPDSSQIAIAGIDDKGQRDMSLFVFQRDTTKENKAREERKEAKEKEDDKQEDKEDEPGFFEKRFKNNEHIDKPSEKEQPIIIWDRAEVDHGQIHKSLKWSPDGRKLAYAKYRFGEHQSLVNDIKMYDLDTEESVWLTESDRATYPAWSPDGNKIIYVVHENSVANIMMMNADGSDKEQITQFEYDTQIVDPSFSPKGGKLVFSMADKNANMDLFIMEMNSRDITRLTTDPAAEYGAVWHPGGDFISFTSHASSTPNIHTVNVSTGESRQVTDVGDAVWSAQWSPVDSSIMATTLFDVDTIRIVNVDPHRSITTNGLNMRPMYTDWRSAEPDHVLKGIDPEKDVKINDTHAYTPLLGIKHMTTIALPLGESVMSFTQWADAMSRHLLTGLSIYDLTGKGSHYTMAQYANAMGGPIWSITYLSELDIKSRPYDRSAWGLFEENTSLSFDMFLTYNFGNNMSDNHVLSSGIKFTKRHGDVLQDIDEETGEMTFLDSTDFRYLPIPASGREGLITLGYTWRNRRPHAKNIMIPDQGHGLNLMIQHANSGLFGVFDYTRLIADAFINLKPHEKSPVTFFGRLKTVSMSGDKPPPQDMPSITNDTPIYVGGFNILGPDEVVHLRGWDNWRLGDTMVFGTFEARIGVPQFSIAAFVDHGNSWFADSEKENWLFTGGYEARVNLLGFIIAYGTAQDFNRWRNNDIPINYFRLSLVNPF